ncbi:hypothetical protein LOK49_Contig120G00002 [Camellia lanceoleosa]|nr:hypothetical protein LOK49_Contig120G00002 [Camellia lanceoleosa]
MILRWRKMNTNEFDQRSLSSSSFGITNTIFLNCSSPQRLMFSLRSLMVMAVLTVSLLVLPVVLPPLPPPPLMLLLIPVFIMAVLILLAFTPSQVPNVAITSV